MSGALRQRQASEYIGLEPESRWLDDAPIPRCDIRKPGAQRPVWVWRVADLDAFLESRKVLPGHPSPFR